MSALQILQLERETSGNDCNGLVLFFAIPLDRLNAFFSVSNSQRLKNLECFRPVVSTASRRAGTSSSSTAPLCPAAGQNRPSHGCQFASSPSRWLLPSPSFLVRAPMAAACAPQCHHPPMAPSGHHKYKVPPDLVTNAHKKSCTAFKSTNTHVHPLTKKTYEPK